MGKLGEIFRFKNGKSVEYDESGRYVAHGSNGPIGRTEKSNASAGTSVIGRVGEYCGSTSYLKKEGWVSDNAIIAQTKQGNSDRYGYYLLKHLPLQGFSGGSAQPLLNQRTLRDIDVGNIPPLPVQRRIADILGVLDDKIELNRRMNETLEEMAQTLYRHWFVDFGPFQDRAFKDTEELGPIPEGWEIQKVKEFGKVVLGSTPSTKDEENYGSDYPFIKIPDMHGKVFVDRTENYLSEKGAESQYKRFLPPNSVVVSCIATPGLVTITSQKSQTNQQINSVIPNDETLREYLYLTFDHESPRIKRLASGGTATAILNKTDFSNVELLSPPSGVIEAFHDQCSEWFDLMKSNVTENQTLAETRDYLLPKLISGDIEIEAAEEAAEASV